MMFWRECCFLGGTLFVLGDFYDGRNQVSPLVLEKR